MIREVAAVGEAIPSLTDAGGYLFYEKYITPSPEEGCYIR